MSTALQTFLAAVLEMDRKRDDFVDKWCCGVEVIDEKEVLNYDEHALLVKIAPYQAAAWDYGVNKVTEEQGYIRLSAEQHEIRALKARITKLEQNPNTLYSDMAKKYADQISQQKYQGVITGNPGQTLGRVNALPANAQQGLTVYDLKGDVMLQAGQTGLWGQSPTGTASSGFIAQQAQAVGQYHGQLRAQDRA